jgi:hypothetical protein
MGEQCPSSEAHEPIIAWETFSVGMARMARAMDPHTRQATTIVDELKRKLTGMSDDVDVG